MPIPEQLLTNDQDLGVQRGQPGIAKNRAAYPLALGWIPDDQVAVDDVPPSAG
jgi:hypothetical protein